MPQQSSPRLFASEIADSLAERLRCGEKAHNELFLVALDIGQHLANCGHPGRWDLFTAEGLFRNLSYLGPVKLERIALRAMAMFHHLADLGALGRRRVAQISKEIQRETPASEKAKQLHAVYLAESEQTAALP